MSGRRCARRHSAPARAVAARADRTDSACNKTSTVCGVERINATVENLPSSIAILQDAAFEAVYHVRTNAVPARV